MLKPRKVLKNIKPYSAGQFKDGCIKLASNENPLGPSPKAMQAVMKASVGMQLYPDGESLKLRTAVARLYRLPKDCFIFGNGSDEVMQLIAAAYIEAGDRVAISRVTFSEYESSAKLFGAVPIYVPLKNNTFDLQGFRKVLRRKPKIVYLCNPNNPTGTIFTAQELREFLKAVPASTLVVLDEAYNEYVDSSDYPDSIALLEAYTNLIVLRTFSKIYGLAGLRIGYGIAAKEVIAELNRARAPFNVNRLAQVAALAALDDRSFLLQALDVNDDGKAYLYEQLKKLGLSFERTEANFIYVEVPRPAQEIFKKMMEHGVTIRPLDSFGRPQAIRITVGAPWQNKRCIEALKKAIGKNA